MDEQFNESLKTIRNVVEIAVILTNLSREELLPTILEILLIEVQDMVGTYCVVRDA